MLTCCTTACLHYTRLIDNLLKMAVSMALHTWWSSPWQHTAWQQRTVFLSCMWRSQLFCCQPIVITAAVIHACLHVSSLQSTPETRHGFSNKTNWDVTRMDHEGCLTLERVTENTKGWSQLLFSVSCATVIYKSSWCNSNHRVRLNPWRDSLRTTKFSDTLQSYWHSNIQSEAVLWYIQADPAGSAHISVEDFGNVDI